MKITVVITVWQVPYSQVVTQIRKFENPARALLFINAQSKAWWQAHDGDRCCAEYPETAPYKPITELGYDTAHYELWGGESGFTAMLDHASYATLHDRHYAGKPLPGYLQVSDLQGHKPT